MLFKIGVENNNEDNRSIAWALEHPGCYAYGVDEAQALANLPAAIRDYAAWIGGREASWVDADEIEIFVEETFTDFDIDGDYNRVESGSYTVEPFFLFEWKPLAASEIERARKMLAWAFDDLVKVLESLTVEKWSYQPEGERWDIAGIVKHIGGAEWWYVDRLGLAFPRAEVPKDPLDRLGKVHALMRKVLPTFEGLDKVVGANGEFWSPRKVVRRALWHMRDHTGHIQKLLA